MRSDFVEWIGSLGLPGLIALSLVAALVAAVALNRYRAISAAKRVVAMQAFPAHPKAIESMLQEAKSMGKYDATLKDLALLRRRFGHENVCNGHLYWIYGRMRGEFGDDVKPPDYSKASTK